MLAWVVAVPVFQTIKSHRKAIAALADKLRPQTAQPGEVIITKGGVNTEMYFVVSGLVDVHVDLNYAAVAQLGPRKYFGEGALATAEPRTAFVRASAEGAALLVLTRDDVTDVLRQHPDAEQMYRAKARAVVAQARKEQDMGNQIFHNAMDLLKSSATSFAIFEGAPDEEERRVCAARDQKQALAAVTAAINCTDLKSPRVKNVLHKKLETINLRLAALTTTRAEPVSLGAPNLQKSAFSFINAST